MPKSPMSDFSKTASLRNELDFMEDQIVIDKAMVHKDKSQKICTTPVDEELLRSTIETVFDAENPREHHKAAQVPKPAKEPTKLDTQKSYLIPSNEPRLNLSIREKKEILESEIDELLRCLKLSE